MNPLFLPVMWDPNLPPSAFLVGDRLTWCKGTLSRQTEIRAALTDLLGGVGVLVRGYAWLVREPHNAVDPNAIAVFIGRHRVGFVPAPIAAIMAPTIESLVGERFGAVPLGHPSCLVTVDATSDGGLVVGLIGPWPQHLTRGELAPSSRRLPPDSEEPRPSAPEPSSGASSWRFKAEAITRVKMGMTRDELVAAVGSRPGKVDERVTKKGARHVLHFIEDPMKDGRFLLKVTLENGIVVSWAGVQDD